MGRGCGGGGRDVGVLRLGWPWRTDWPNGSGSPARSSRWATCPAGGKADLPENDALPDIEVEPDTFTVRIDGEVIEEAPAAELPMAQRYFLF